MKSNNTNSSLDVEKSLQFIEESIRMLSLDYKEDPVGTIYVLTCEVGAVESEGVDMSEYRLRLADLTGVMERRSEYLRLSLRRREEMMRLRSMLATTEAIEGISWDRFNALESEFFRLATKPFSRHRKNESGESNATPLPPLRSPPPSPSPSPSTDDSD